MLILNSQIFLVNRKMEIYQCEGKLGTRCTDTLLDAEVVQELPPPGPHPSTTPLPSFSLMIFDALCVSGRNVRYKDIQQRMSSAKAFMTGGGVCGTLPFAHIECKQYHPVAKISTVLDLVPKANHNTDGLISYPISFFLLLFYFTLFYCDLRFYNF